MEMIVKINTAVNNFVWGAPALILIVGTGIFMSVRLGFPQFRRFGYVMKNTFGKIFHKTEQKEGAVTPFQAMCTALAGTVGTGNIAGVCGAIAIGGPGAVFWMWFSALMGMATKFSEITLAVNYRERNEKGDWVGGPMYYIKNGLGKKWSWLAAVFAVFGTLAAFGIGNATQTNTIASSISEAFLIFNPDANANTIHLIVGIILCVLAAIVLLGGIQRIGQVCELLVPAMAVVYIVAGIGVVVLRAGELPSVFAAIFKGAFQPSAVAGGLAGATMMTAIQKGVGRGVFSNEAGLGSAPMAHAASSESDPVKQGLYGVFEVFMDTIVICSLTSLALLSGALGGGIDIVWGSSAGTELIAAAFGTVFGGRAGSLIIAIGITLFALSTVLSWSLYGTRCFEFLFKGHGVRIYQIIFVCAIIIGSTLELELVWNIADMLNGFMAIPNLVALLGLSGVVIRLTREHFSGQSTLK